MHHEILQRAELSRARATRPALALLIAVALLLGVSQGPLGGGRASAESGPAVLPVGALLSLTGPSSTLGLTSQAALELAAADINSQPASAGLPYVTLTIADTQLDPASALASLQALYAQGIRVVIGPQTSSELAAIKDFAAANGITIISQGSTASSLAIAGDSIFRMVPDDVVETEAMAALLKADGITTVVPVGRDDVGNQGLVQSLTTAFTASGGTVTAPITYAANTTDFGPVVSQIEAALGAAQQTAGAKAGIYLAGFSEVSGLFDAASQSAALGAVPWYGSDGVALSDALTSDPVAAAFAQKVGYPNPTVGLDQSPQAKALWQPIADKITQMTGLQPDTFGLAAYDALELAAHAAAQASPSDVAAFDQALVSAADSTTGITGPLAFNNAGDRATSPFAFWQVCRQGGAYTWVVGAMWTPSDGGGQITREAGCGTAPSCTTVNLSGRWSMIAWPGPDSDPAAALTGGSCGSGITSSVAVIWGFDAQTQTWQAYFPGATAPGANDLATLTHGGGYFVALTDASATVAWSIAAG